MGDEFIAGNAGDDEGVVLRATRTDDDRVGGTQAIERRDAYLVEIRANFAEEHFAFLELQFVGAEGSRGFPCVKCERSARDMFQSNVRLRFVELTCLAYNIGGGNGANPWDQHGKLREGHEKMAQQVDQPIAALLQDLKSRGLLDETLVVWAGEFGRTPFSQGSDGRDHNPFGFSVWLAGGGIKGGSVYGATDEYGYEAIDKPCDVYDLWATVLHLLGLDHRDLTYRYGGRDIRLTDVHGDVLHDVIRA